MPKLKTHKATAKRFTNKKGKVMKRVSGQNHFNSKDSGSKRSSKRKDTALGCKTLTKTVKTLIVQRNK